MIIIIISSIIYSYISNNSNINNTRRKIDKIEGDITKTMSDFIVDNYKPPEINLKLILEEFKNETNNKYLELKNENRTKIYLRKLAFDYIGRLNWNQWFHISGYYYFKDKSYTGNDLYKSCECTEQDIEKIKKYAVSYFNNNFDKLYKIDYDNFLISLSEFSNNVKENYEIIMKIFFNETIEFDEKNIIKNPIYKNNGMGNNDNNINYYYKFICINVIPSVKFSKIDVNGFKE